MTILSLWARKYRASAQIVIFSLHIVLLLLAVSAGKTFGLMGLQLPGYAFLFTCMLFVFAVLFYPSRGNPGRHVKKRKLYIIRKSCDFILGISSFFLVFFLAGRYDNAGITPAMFSAKAIMIPGDKDNQAAAEILTSLSYRDKSTLTRSEKRILRHEFRRQLKAYAAARLNKDDDRAGKIVLVILSIVAAVGLTFLLAGLSCSIACSGAEGLAVLAFVAGLAGIVILLVYTIRKIKSYHRKPTEEKPSATAN